MGYSTTVVTGYGFSIDEEVEEWIWKFYKNSENPKDWILEEEDTYEMMEEVMKSFPGLTFEYVDFMGEPLGALVLVKRMTSSHYDYGVFETPSTLLLGWDPADNVLYDFAETFGIESDPE